MTGFLMALALASSPHSALSVSAAGSAGYQDGSAVFGTGAVARIGAAPWAFELVYHRVFEVPEQSNENPGDVDAYMLGASWTGVGMLSPTASARIGMADGEAGLIVGGMLAAGLAVHSERFVARIMLESAFVSKGQGSRGWSRTLWGLAPGLVIELGARVF